VYVRCAQRINDTQFKLVLSKATSAAMKVAWMVLD
jgi:hypothetical protein